MDDDVYFSYRPAGGVWGPNGRVNDTPGWVSGNSNNPHQEEGISQRFPSVGADQSGNFYAVWEDTRRSVWGSVGLQCQGHLFRLLSSAWLKAVVH